jgi:hypothetical protein
MVVDVQRLQASLERVQGSLKLLLPTQQGTPRRRGVVLAASEEHEIAAALNDAGSAAMQLLSFLHSARVQMVLTCSFALYLLVMVAEPRASGSFQGVLFCASVAVLGAFLLELMLLMAILRGQFVGQPLYVLETFAVNGALALRVIAWLSAGGATAIAASLAAVSVVLTRCWRLVRYGRGLSEAAHEAHVDELAEHVQALADQARQPTLDAPRVATRRLDAPLAVPLPAAAVGLCALRCRLLWACVMCAARTLCLSPADSLRAVARVGPPCTGVLIAEESRCYLRAWSSWACLCQPRDRCLRCHLLCGLPCLHAGGSSSAGSTGAQDT